MSSNILQPIKDGYGKFKFFDSNRDLASNTLDAIYDDIDSTYLLDLYPIVTDPEWMIHDGQHRFTIAKELRLPFYAIQSEHISVTDIALANNNTIPYSVDDVRYSYAKLGLKAYAYLNSFLSKNPFMPTAFSIKLLNQDCGRQNFLDGFFSVKTPEYAQVVADFIKDYVEQKKFAAYKPYTTAIANLALNPIYDHSKMKERLKSAPTMLLKCNTEQEVFSIISDLYNYRAWAHNRAELVKLEKNQQLNRYDKNTTEINDLFCPPSRGIVFRPVEVKVSSEYHQFTEHPARRPVPDKLKRRMIEEIKRKNLLHCYPIICDASFRIIDGHRRFFAAVELGLPIHYIQSASVSLPMTIRASNRSKAWAFSDYLKSYCVLGKENYLKIADFCKRNPDIPLSVAFILAANVGYAQKVVLEFKTGDLQIPALDILEKVGNVIKHPIDRDVKKSKIFQCALFEKIRDDSEFYPDKFIEKSMAYPDIMKGFVDRLSCLERIDKVYHHYSRN